MNEAIFYLLGGLRDLCEHAQGANTVLGLQVPAYNTRHSFLHLQEAKRKKRPLTRNEFVSMNVNELS